MKTMQVFAVLAVFLTFEACSSEELTCYSCTDCQPNFVTDLANANTETCTKSLVPGVEPRCMKIIDAAGVINRRCADTLQCAISETVAKCDGDDVNCLICCEEDKCNSATSFHISALVVLVAAAVHKILF